MKEKYLQLASRMSSVTPMQAASPCMPLDSRPTSTESEESPHPSQESSQNPVSTNTQEPCHSLAEEIALVQFACKYKDSQGIMKVSCSKCSFYKLNECIWSTRLKEISDIQKSGDDSLCFSLKADRYTFTTVSKCRMVYQLMKTLLRPYKALPLTSTCETSISKQIDIISQHSLLTDITFSIPMDRLISHYILSSHFYQSLLLLGEDFDISIGKWFECGSPGCCKELRREVVSHHLYRILKKQIPCKIKQCHMFVYHKEKNAATLTIQHTTSNSPIQESFTLLFYWIIEKVDHSRCRIRVAIKTGTNSGIVNSVIKKFVKRESQAVCRRWIRAIQEREIMKPAFALPKIETTIEKQSNSFKQITIWVWTSLFLLFVIVQYIKYHSCVCFIPLCMEKSQFVFSPDYSATDYRILVLNDLVKNEITEGKLYGFMLYFVIYRVSFKGEDTGQCILSTPTKSFALEKIETSNTVLLCREEEKNHFSIQGTVSSYLEVITAFSYIIA